MNENVYLNWSFKVSNVLTAEEIDYMMGVINSDLTNAEKAEHLFNFCSYRTVLSNRDFYRPSKNFTPDISKQIKSDLKDQTTQLFCKLEKIAEYYEIYEDMGYAEDYKNPYMCSGLEIEQRIKKLSILNKVLNSSINEYNKVEIMLKLFKNSEELRRQYKLFIKYGKNDHNLDQIRGILNNFDKLLDKYKELESKKEIVNTIRYYEKYKEFYDNYNYAEFIVHSYIDYDNNDINEFLDLLGLTKEMFDYYVIIIKELNPSLYSEYNDKVEKNKEKDQDNIKEAIKNIYCGINTGFLPDCTPFNTLEFLKIVPFKNMSFLFNLKDYMKKNTPEMMDTIIKYMIDNKLYKIDLFKPLDIGAIIRVKSIVNGVIIKEEENEIIIDFLKVNDIPLVNASYSIAREMFINGEIDIDRLYRKKDQKINQSVKKKVLLVPSGNI